MIRMADYPQRIVCLTEETTETLYLIDPFAFADEALRPVWDLLADPARALVVHAGREEVRLCHRAVGRMPGNLFDLQIVAGMVTFAVFLLLWVITWIGSAAGPTAEKITQYLSIVDHYDDFGKGVLDTTHLVYYLSFISFGLFLTAKSVDSERWRG